MSRDLRDSIIASLIGVATFLALFFVLVVTVAAHSWYPAECCSGIDCDVLLDERVHSAPGGYLVDGKHFIAQSAVRKSPDEHFHGCFPSKDKMGCFWAPPQGS